MLGMNLITKVFLYCLTGISFLFACQPEGKDQTKVEVLQEPIAGYYWGSPVKRYFMPYELDEISGLAYYRKDLLASVQDEDGKLFIFDLKEGKVVQRVKFGNSGDYEGVAMINKNFVVVRSDGKLFQFGLKGGATREISTSPLSPRNDIEGLTYDKDTKQLLLACKEKAGLDNNDLKGKSIYAFDIETNALLRKPRFVITSKDLELFLKNKGRDGKVKRFKPSAVDIHPKTGQIFVIASAGSMVAILEPDGSIAEVVSLSRKLFKQPEGICFAPDGTLYISSEGSPGYILEFAYNKKQ